MFLVTGIWHVVLTWMPIVGYLKNRSKLVRVLAPESTLAPCQGELPTAGMEIDPDERLREEATRLGTDPEGLPELLNARAGQRGGGEDPI